MKRIGLITLSLVAVFAISGVAASSAAANGCAISSENKGNFNRRTPDNFANGACELPVAAGTGRYIIVDTKGVGIAANTNCAEVAETGTGNYGNARCQGSGEEKGNFIKIVNPGPHWHINGVQLKQGVKQIKLQLKGSAVLKTPELKAEISCKDSGSEGATIEGKGEGQGQGKGRVTYSQCTVLKPSECTVAEPITTKQLKSYLAYANTQTKVVSVFEPTEAETPFVTLKFSGKGCGKALEGERGVLGSIAAEVIPFEKEGQEGLITFPQTPITKIIHEGIETKIGLNVVGFSSTFSGAYGARLQTEEPFGVFEN